VFEAKNVAELLDTLIVPENCAYVSVS